MATSNRRLGRSPARRSRPVEDLASLEARYLAHHRALGHSPKTVSHYQDTFLVFERFLTEAGIASDLAAVATDTMRAFAAWLRESPSRGWRGRDHRSEAGIHGILVDLRAFGNWLVAEELLDKPPKVPVPKLPQTFFPVLSDDDLARVFACKQLDPRTEIGTRNRALIAFMLDTGVRRTEAVNLMLAELDAKEGTARVVGKGRKERMVFFAPATAELLKRWLAIRGDEPGSLFWLASEGIRMLFVRIRRETGLAVFHPHQIRHTTATNLLRGGADTHSVRRMLGHASVVTTEKYLSLSTQDLKDKHTVASPYARLSERLEPTPIRGKRRLRSA